MINHLPEADIAHGSYTTQPLPGALGKLRNHHTGHFTHRVQGGTAIRSMPSDLAGTDLFINHLGYVLQNKLYWPCERACNDLERILPTGGWL